MAYGGREPYSGIPGAAFGGGTPATPGAPLGDSTGYLTRLQRLRPLLAAMGQKQPGPLPMIPQYYGGDGGGGRQRQGTEDVMQQAMGTNPLATLMFTQPRTLSQTVNMGSGHAGGYRPGQWFDQPHDQMQAGPTALPTADQYGTQSHLNYLTEMYGADIGGQLYRAYLQDPQHAALGTEVSTMRQFAPQGKRTIY